MHSGEERGGSKHPPRPCPPSVPTLAVPCALTQAGEHAVPHWLWLRLARQLLQKWSAWRRWDEAQIGLFGWLHTSPRTRTRLLAARMKDRK